MLYCTNCVVRISTRTDCCPLCARSLPDSPDPNVTQTFPAYFSLQKRSGIRVSVAAIISFALIILLLIGLISRQTISFVMPIMISCVILALDFNILIKKDVKHTFRYLLASCAAALFILIIALFWPVQPVYPSVAAAGLSVLTLAGLMLLAKETVISEIRKIFHT